MLFALTGGEWHVAPVGLKPTVIKGAAPSEVLAVAVAVCNLTHCLYLELLNGILRRMLRQ